MASRFRVEPLFATPLIRGRIADETLAPALEEAILRRREEHPGVQRSNIGGWHSDVDLLEWGGKPAHRLLNEILNLAERSTLDLAAPGTKLRWQVEAWANVSASGAANARHVHGASYWSAVYYVRAGEGRGGELVLFDPRMPMLGMHAPFLRFRNVVGERELRIAPKTGELLIFPSWLMHKVEPWYGEGVRISVAINLKSAGSAPSDALMAPPDRATGRSISKPTKDER